MCVQGAAGAAMRGSYRASRFWRSASSRAAAGLALICCVLLMHGFQASNSPADMSGLPTMSTGHAPMAAHEAGSRGPRPSSGDQLPDSNHDHPGGQVCLALLMLVGLVAMLLATGFIRQSVLPALRSMARSGPRSESRSPPRPSILQLAVLRL